jgi:hypothetical protein
MAMDARRDLQARAAAFAPVNRKASALLDNQPHDYPKAGRRGEHGLPAIFCEVRARAYPHSRPQGAARELWPEATDAGHVGLVGRDQARPRRRRAPRQGSTRRQPEPIKPSFPAVRACARPSWAVSAYPMFTSRVRVQHNGDTCNMPPTGNSPRSATDGGLLIQGKNRRKQASAPTLSTLRSARNGKDTGRCGRDGVPTRRGFCAVRMGACARHGL